MTRIMEDAVSRIDQVTKEAAGDAFIQSYVDDGWVIAYEDDASAAGGRRVLRDGKPGRTYGLNVVVGPDGEQFPSFNFSATSPCSEDDARR